MARVVIKLGSSIVADEGGSLRSEVLARICDVLAREHARGGEVVIVSSGAIALGVRVMGLAARPALIPELQAASAVGQGGLYRAYHELLRARGVGTGQVLLSIGDLSARAGYLNARHTFAKLLEWRVVPVVNENDTTATDEISFGDNDFLAAHIALLVGAELLVLLTDIDGLYSADPRLDPEAKLVSEVHDFEALRELEIGASTSPLGSGGMRSKVVAADMATAAGTTTIVCNGLREGVLEDVLAGRPAGTRFQPRHSGHSAFKLWLRYAKPTLGTLVVDRGAARALREAHTSLLPVGIVAVVGDFEAGDAVEIAVEGKDKEGAGLMVAKGIADYSSAELARVKGLKSAAVRELLPHASEEAVHRDRLVML
ncbi:MAG TPA: glutamate 5-kinase [Solirubrobacteraceae bacterium]|jgi:glutamate 5-kinase|nr:glutamate 5-kinase [Solirubrobacteraceae bacterium]